MIDRKTWLVARREFVENVRTKTFWIGIFILPVIYGIAIGANVLMSRAKEVRSYAVLDRSEGQWLSKAIEARGDQGDVMSAVDTIEAFKGIEKEVETRTHSEMLAALRSSRSAALEAAANDTQRGFFERYFEIAEAALQKRVDAGEGDQKVAMMAFAQEVGLQMVPVYQEMTPQERSLLKGGLDRSKYRFVPLSEIGTAVDDPEAEKKLNDWITDGKLFAWFEIPAQPVESDENARYISNNLTDGELRSWYSGNATDVVRRRRIEEVALTELEAKWISDPFSFDKSMVTKTGETEDVGADKTAAQFAPVAFVYLLWIAVFTAAQMLLTNTVEEKSNRLIEVLLSSVSPMQLMSGKVLGIAATGLTLVGSWVVTAIVGTWFIPEGSKLAEFQLGQIIADPLYFGSFIAYFLAGYLIYGAVLVALGSVCNSLKEAQNLMQPVFILLIVPLIAMIPVVQEPNGMVARILTYIPLFTPFLMMNRAGGPPPAWEYIATTILIVVTLWFAFRMAAKVFRVGILMTGKPPKIGEILRWLRAPVGAVPDTGRSEPSS